MQPRAKLSFHLRALLLTLLWVWLPSTLLLTAAVIVSLSSDAVRLTNLFRDPTSILGEPFYLGFISNLGILLWAATAAICLFSYAVLSRYGRDRELVRFLLWAGLGTTILCLDDRFLLHEEAFPDYLGIREEIIFGAYGLLLILYLFRFGDVILRTEYAILAVAFMLFGLSILFDLFPPQHGLGSGFGYFLEDAPKFLGIGTWLMYFSCVSARAFQQEFSNTQYQD